MGLYKTFFQGFLYKVFPIYKIIICVFQEKKNFCSIIIKNVV